MQTTLQRTNQCSTNACCANAKLPTLVYTSLEQNILSFMHTRQDVLSRSEQEYFAELHDKHRAINQRLKPMVRVAADGLVVVLTRGGPRELTPMQPRGCGYCPA